MDVAQTVLVGLALVTAGSASVRVLWTQVIRPTMRFHATAEEMLPLLRVLTDVYAQNPDWLLVLADIAAQFQADSGSSLRDVVNRIEAAGNEAAAAVVALKETADAEALRLAVGVETGVQLRADDRRKMDDLMLALDRVAVRQAAGIDTAEATAATVKEDLDRGDSV